MEQRLLGRNLFSLSLSRTDEEKGELIFGTVDTNLYTGDLISIPVSNVTDGTDELSKYCLSCGWQLPVQSISIGANSTSSAIYADLANYTAVFATNIPYIGLDGHQIVLTPWDYLFEVEDDWYGKKCAIPFGDIETDEDSPG